MITRSYHCVLLALFSVFLLIPAAWGGGVWLYEGGTPDLGYDDTWHFALGAQYRFAER